MNKLWMVLVLLLAGCAGEVTEPNVLIIGDSISIGYTHGVRNKRKGVDRLPGFYIRHNPGNAETSDHTIMHLDEWLAPHQWNIIHWNNGIWDIHHYWSKDFTEARTADTIATYRANMEFIANRLDKTGAIVIIATTTPIPGTPPEIEKRYNQVILDIAQEHGYIVDDLYTLMLPYPNLHPFPTSMHYVNEGYRLMGAQVAQTIEQAWYDRQKHN